MLAKSTISRERPPGRRPEEHDALQDGVGVLARGGDGGHHREQVGRQVADGGGDQERQRALQGVPFPEAQFLAAARTAPFLRAGRGTRQQAAAFAALQALLDRGHNGRAHGVASTVRSPAVAGRAAASAHSTLSHTTRGSKFDWIAGSKKTSPPTANSASPGSTVA